MYQLLIVDKNATIPLHSAEPKHSYRAPQIGEHLVVKWEGQTKICEVVDIWTHVNLDGAQPTQHAVQVLIRWSNGIDPALYARRFR